MQANLFPSLALPTKRHLPNGLAYRVDAIEPDEEKRLIALIDALPLTPFRFQGWLGKRLTHSFGWSYDFDKGEAAAASPMPQWIMPIQQMAADFAGLRQEDLSQALLIRYDPGAGIGWHRDRPIFEDVLGISLGAPAALRFRRRTDVGFDRCALPLQPRSIYHLVGDARHIWEHSILPMDRTRWSITFRTLSKTGRKLLLP